MEFHKILVPVAGVITNEEIIELADNLLAKKNKGEICAVYVISIERTLPVDAEIESEIGKAENILNNIERIAVEQGLKIDTDLLQAREAGPAIVDEAIEREADLILMGLTYKRRFGEFSLGDVVPYVLKNAPCRVILYHQVTLDEFAE
ncbi:MAG: universal stress protein [Dehalococcoidales bacterium]|nr:universal stress protein [Dehalococcoidales bacterium]